MGFFDEDDLTDEQKREILHDLLDQFEQAKMDDIKKRTTGYLVIPMTPEMQQKWDCLVKALETATQSKVNQDLLMNDVFHAGVEGILLLMKQLLEKAMR